jgi:hypothetical protein
MMTQRGRASRSSTGSGSRRKAMLANPVAAVIKSRPSNAAVLFQHLNNAIRTCCVILSTSLGSLWVACA